MIRNCMVLHEQKTVATKLLYNRKFSSCIKKELNKIVHLFKPQFKLNYITYSSFKMGQLLRKSLGRISFHYKSHVVYHNSCACGQSYIGQTGHTISDRVREHKEA